jgi:hypothetical protein
MTFVGAASLSRLKCRLPGHSRQQFDPDEDALLLRLVAAHGTVDWSSIAANVPGRTSRQCRERYQLFLNPDLDNGPWAPEEDFLLMHLFPRYGPDWAAIRCHFPKRSNNNIKNRWTVLRKQATIRRPVIAIQFVCYCPVNTGWAPCRAVAGQI